MKIGRIWGVNIYLNPFFLALLGLFFVAGILGKGLIAFAVVLLHEFFHVFMAKKLGVPVADVELLPFGGVTRMGADMPVNPGREIRIAAAGPAGNLALFLAGIALKNHGVWHETLGPFFLQSNMVIAAFNVLPALPLDGGRIYRACLAGKAGIRKATYRAAVLGQFWGGAITSAGVIGLVLCWCGLDISITGLFLFYAATREKLSAPYLFMQHIMEKKNDLAVRRVLPMASLAVMEDATLGQVVRMFLPGRFYVVAVFSREMKLRGAVDENRVIESLFEKGVDHQIGDIVGN
ncbi:MAG: M50 family metallopeptidase [Bacillota bacterium]